MNRRIVTAAMALSMSVFASQAFAQAFSSAPATGSNTTTTNSTMNATTAMPHGKQISFHLRNDSAAAVTIQAGNQQMTVAPGKSVSLKLATGTQVTTTSGTAHVAAGGVLATVDSNLSGNTLVIS